MKKLKDLMQRALKENVPSEELLGAIVREIERRSGGPNLFEQEILDNVLNLGRDYFYRNQYFITQSYGIDDEYSVDGIMIALGCNGVPAHEPKKRVMKMPDAVVSAATDM